MSNLKEITIINIANGVATEMFDRELKSVLDNISDINTGALETREIILKFSIKPDHNRDNASVTVTATSKLCPVNGARGQLFFGKKAGKLVAYGQDINQQDLFQEPSLALVKEGVPV